MVNYLEILHFIQEGYTQRNISTTLGCSRDTIRDVSCRAKSKKIVWDQIKDCSNEEIHSLLYPERFTSKVYRQPDCSYIHNELLKKGVTLLLLWEEYTSASLEENQVPYGYTQFCQKYRTWTTKRSVTMRIKHKPGDSMQVDWAGATIPIQDPISGDRKKAYLFVAVLPYSCYAYVELCADMKLETWLYCHVHAFEYFNGVARLLIPDNLKTGVTKNTKYETVLNKSYAEMADFFGTAIVPARVRAPKDKSLVEGTVNFATRMILAPLRNRTFFNLEDAQVEVRKGLEKLNNKEFQKRKGSRREIFELDEQKFLQPLPTSMYEPSEWLSEKVPLDYCITDGVNKYSVPYDLVGEKVEVKVSCNVVRIYFHQELVATHPRIKERQNTPIILPQHMPENHKIFIDCNKTTLLKKFESIGEKSYQVAKQFLEKGRAPEQGYKACLTLLKLAQKYSPAILEKVCDEVIAVHPEASLKVIVALLRVSSQNENKNRMQYKKRHEKKINGFTRGAKEFKGGMKHD